jgi:hypothetical protein
MKRTNRIRKFDGTGYGRVWLEGDTMGLQTHTNWVNNVIGFLVTAHREEKMKNAMLKFEREYLGKW